MVNDPVILMKDHRDKTVWFFLPEGYRMKNTLGNVVKLTVFGESHGDAVGCVLDGIPAGLPVNEVYIQKQLMMRQSMPEISTSRREPDQVRILSGVRNGYTEGTPVTFLLENTNVRRKDYDALAGVLRPGHADYTAQLKYHGYQDASGGGHFSGRLTAPMTAAGALCRSLLENYGIVIGSHIAQLYNVQDQGLPADPEAVRKLNEKMFAVLDEQAEKEMLELIHDAREQGDSLGGILETVILGLPGGLGEPLFGSAESVIAEAMFSIPGVKGIEFGSGFGFAEMYGSEANDAFIVRDDKIQTETNHNGGINGGITNGMPVVFRTMIKPTPSISKTQKTVDMKTMEETTIEIRGRHDPAIIHRARTVVDNLTAFVLVDLLTEVYGVTWPEVLKCA